VTERASGHLRSRSWRALVATVLAALTTLLTAGMTTATAATFTYDVPTVARLDVHKVHIGEGPTALLSEARHGAASRLTWARGTSTTPLARSVATEAGDTVAPPRFVSSKSGIIDTESPALTRQIDDVADSIGTTGSPPPGVRQGGLPGKPGIYGNKSGALRPQPESYYIESDVWPGPGPRGTERVVVGSNGEVWYTPDHYGTFREIR
jgi:guanyl-specific ribonuclease Sa